MVKKRLDRSSWKNKRAQITVFIILGLILLLTFLIIIKLASDVKLSELKTEREKVILKNFQKEALRIYVQDCLNDALEEGLILIGKQGRLWKGQPGGTKSFVNEETGVTYQPGEDIFYGITNENYLEHPNAYPCNDELNSPQFCQYIFPDTTIGFGIRELKTSTVEMDLQRYLTNQTIFCVKNYTRSEISDNAKIEDTAIDLDLELVNDGVNVNVEYPLKLSVGGEEFFIISRFDFFYPNKFNLLLESAIERPIYYDSKFVDFDYSEETLGQPTFPYGSTSPNCPVEGDHYICENKLLYDKYKSLAVEMETLELPNGDNIFIFKSSEILNSPVPYEYRIAVQNRPPALDYISKSQCIAEEPENSYDYLVIPGDDDYGIIDITLNAEDADGDVVTYSFVGLPPEFGGADLDNGEHLLVDGSITPGKYTFTAKASDGNLEDWQEVKVLVDQPLTAELELWSPYNIDGLDYSNYVANNGHIITSEDPVFVNVIYPDGQTATGVELFLNYEVNDEVKFEEDLTELITSGSELCINFPYQEGKGLCDINSPFSNYLNAELDESFSNVITESGKLKLSVSKDYCLNDNLAGGEKEVEFKQVGCIPHVSDNHPFPYIPDDENKLYQLHDCDENNENCQIDPDFNPFLASHVCCNPNTMQPYTATDKKECYTGTEAVEEGCFATDDVEAGYILSKKVPTFYCSGEAGNICGGGAVDYSIVSYPEDEQKCGSGGTGLGACNKVATQCEGKIPYSYQFGANGFWCNGKYGCGEVTVDGSGAGNEVVCTTDIISLDQNYDMNNLNLDYLLSHIDEFVCDCSTKDDDGNPIYENKPCADLKTNVKGYCEGIECKLPSGSGG